jgi:hypothetical protein
MLVVWISYVGERTYSESTSNRPVDVASEVARYRALLPSAASWEFRAGQAGKVAGQTQVVYASNKHRR